LDIMINDRFELRDRQLPNKMRFLFQ
jgi:hypothetical protein